MEKIVRTTVFLKDGQVFAGYLASSNDDTLTLRDKFRDIQRHCDYEFANVTFNKTEIMYVITEFEE